MKLYLECNMGAAGDMLTAALYELLPEPQEFLRKMNSLGLSGVQLRAEESVKCGIMGTHMSVLIGDVEESAGDFHAHIGTVHTHADGHVHTASGFLPEHDHAEHDHGRSYTYGEICGIIEGLDIPRKPKKDALAVYKLLAGAEARVHDATEESVHFHEVGALDAVADIVGVCLAVHMLDVTDIACSPINAGSGFVRCAHGVLPVPAPATALLLEGVPFYTSEVKGELCTPTGAALLRHFVSRFGTMEPMTVGKIGYGMGKKDFERCNCVRAFLGEVAGGHEGYDEITELACNLDDMTPEELGFAVEQLLSEGAVDVFATPVYMKKNRPAYMLTVLCRPEEEQRLTALIFRHTTTLGIRVDTKRRAVLQRDVMTRETKYGAVRIKSARGHGTERRKPEYEDVARLAREHGVSMRDIYEELKD